MIGKALGLLYEKIGKVLVDYLRESVQKGKPRGHFPSGKLTVPFLLPLLEIPASKYIFMFHIFF